VFYLYMDEFQAKFKKRKIAVPEGEAVQADQI
jgi:hypothetical protein